MKLECRLVIDTNLWISRLLLPSGAAARAVDQALALGVPLVSGETLEELSTVLLRKKFDKYISDVERRKFFQLLGGIVRIVKITQKVTVCRDSNDDKFLDVALNGKAQIILTGDKDLLELHPFHGINIRNPSDFLDGIRT